MNLLRLLRRAPAGSLGFSLFLCLLAPAFMVIAYLLGSGYLSFSRAIGPYATYGLAVLALTATVALQPRAIRLYNADFQEALARVRASIVKSLVESEVEVVRATGPVEIAAIVEGDARLVAAVAPSLAVVTVYASWTLVAIVLGALQSWAVLAAYVGVFVLVYFARSLPGSGEPAKRGDAAEARLRAVFDELMAAPRALAVDRQKATALAAAAAAEAREAAKARGAGGSGFARAIAAAESFMLLATLGAHELATGLVPGVAVSDALMLLLIGTSGSFIRVLHSRHELQGADRAAHRLLALEAGLRIAPRVRTAAAPLPFTSLAFEDVMAARAPRPGEAAFVLGPVTLSIPRGSLTVVHGPNGSGKSTLLEVLLGSLRPRGGRIVVDGSPIDDSSVDAYRRLFSAVFAHPHLFERLYGHAEARAVAQARMAWLGLGDVDAGAARAVTETLSTGQRKRVALARALAEERPVLVLDEYTADQDPGARDRFLHEILPRLKAEGRTVIAVLHGSTIPACADYVARLSKGMLVQEPYRP